jgi:hypothetical protein
MEPSVFFAVMLGIVLWVSMLIFVVAGVLSAHRGGPLGTLLLRLGRSRSFRVSSAGVFPLIILWSLVQAIRTHEMVYGVILLSAFMISVPVFLVAGVLSAHRGGALATFLERHTRSFWLSVASVHTGLTARAFSQALRTHEAADGVIAVFQGGVAVMLWVTFAVLARRTVRSPYSRRAGQ